MPDSTDPTATPADGWCHYHKGPSGTARIVELVARQSGPDFARYACAPCRDLRGLKALDEPDEVLAWRQYMDHDYECRSCTVARRCDEGQALWDVHQAAQHGAAVAS